MKIITFKKGDIFHEAIRKYDLCIYFGRNNMSFRIGYSLLKDRYPLFKGIENPFVTYPNTAINCHVNKFFVFVPQSYMSNDEITKNIIEWLEFAQKNNVETIALTGARDSTKQRLASKTLGRENDNERVKFIVKILEHWLMLKQTSIKEVLLIAKSDNYIRNYHKPIIID